MTMGEHQGECEQEKRLGNIGKEIVRAGKQVINEEGRQRGIKLQLPIHQRLAASLPSQLVGLHYCLWFNFELEMIIYKVVVGSFLLKSQNIRRPQICHFKNKFWGGWAYNAWVWQYLHYDLFTFFFSTLEASCVLKSQPHF